LAGHVHAQFCFGVVDQFSADVHRDAVDGAGELERAGVVVGDRGTGVGAAGQRARIERERGGDGRFRVPGEGAVDVELELAGRALTVLQVWLSSRLELGIDRFAYRVVDFGGFRGECPS
jgi:hypothetical protein